MSKMNIETEFQNYIDNQIPEFNKQDFLKEFSDVNDVFNDFTTNSDSQAHTTMYLQDINVTSERIRENLGETNIGINEQKMIEQSKKYKNIKKDVDGILLKAWEGKVSLDHNLEERFKELMQHKEG